MTKQFVLQSCFFIALLKHTNIMTEQEHNLLMNVLPDVYICLLRKKSAPLLPEGAVKCTHLAA